MHRRRFYFVEPSKVGDQHITLIEGYLRALLQSAAVNGSFELVFGASPSTFASLPADMRREVKHEPVPVMNPERRRLARKTFVEFVVVVKYLMRLRAGDVLFVSCVLPTTLLFLELLNRWFKRKFFVVLHGEIEGLFDPSSQRVTSFGFWASQWLKRRGAASTIKIVVIEDFIMRRLLDAYPEKFTDANVFVVHHPIHAMDPGQSPTRGRIAVCFVGYRTRHKGFDSFVQLSEAVTDVDFLAIGNRTVQNVRSGEVRSIAGGDYGYLREIAQCAAAIFPYSAGYTCSLSAAALDALAAGVHIVATNRPCFVSLREHFGAAAITVVDSMSDTIVLLKSAAWLKENLARRSQRRAAVLSSRFGLSSVKGEFERLVSSA